MVDAWVCRNCRQVVSVSRTRPISQVSSAGRLLEPRRRDHGHVVPGYVADVLNELLRSGLVMLADPDPTAENIAAAALTNAGVVRFAQLCQTALGLPAAQVTTLCGAVLPD
jgi:hypothetical protein